MDNLNIVLDKEYKTYSLGPKKTTVFYHGGASKNFGIGNIDVFRKSEKQQNTNNSYSGFYMYGEDDYKSAITYAINENRRKNTNDKGIVKLELDSDLNIYTVPPFSITRITTEQIRELKNQGYDLIKGKMLGKDEYILLNKAKIQNIEFQSLATLENMSKEELEQIREQVEQIKGLSFEENEKTK